MYNRLVFYLEACESVLVQCPFHRSGVASTACGGIARQTPSTRLSSARRRGGHTAATPSSPGRSLTLMYNAGLHVQGHPSRGHEGLRHHGGEREGIVVWHVLRRGRRRERYQLTYVMNLRRLDGVEISPLDVHTGASATSTRCRGSRTPTAPSRASRCSARWPRSSRRRRKATSRSSATRASPATSPAPSKEMRRTSTATFVATPRPRSARASTRARRRWPTTAPRPRPACPRARGARRRTVLPRRDDGALCRHRGGARRVGQPPQGLRRGRGFVRRRDVGLLQGRGGRRAPVVPARHLG